MTINLKDSGRTEADTNVLGLATAAPTSGLAPGSAYLVIATATGVFAGHEGDVATFTLRNPEMPWEFSSPAYGDVAYDAANAIYWQWDGTQWDATGDFDALGTSTEAPSGHMKSLVTYATAGNALQEASPMSVLHFEPTPGVSGTYSITVKHDMAVMDCIVVQAAPAGGAGCSVVVTTDPGTGPVLLFDSLALDAVNPAIVRAANSNIGFQALETGMPIIVDAVDNGLGQLPPCAVLVTVVKKEYGT